MDGSQFRVTLFASGLVLPQAMQQLGDGSLVVQHSVNYTGGQLVRYVDANGDGVADGFGPGIGQGTALYTNADGQGPVIQLVSAGGYLLQGTFGDKTISLLKVGATPSSPLTEAGSLQFGFPADWLHSSAGLAIRPSSNGQAGFYDLVFNVGSDGDATVGGQIPLNGLGLNNELLDGASLYMVTLDLNGNPPTASNLRKVASGVRNSFGLLFDPQGNLWFSDNAMNQGNPGGNPIQADELNWIPAAQLLPGAPIPHFGFPDCFPRYLDGVHALPDDCQHPVASFTPLGPLDPGVGGAAQIAFSPSGFPAALSGGIFIGFAGVGHVRNSVMYYDPIQGRYFEFIVQGSMDYPLGLLAAGNSLFVSDWGSGEIYQIQAIAAPEPATMLTAAAGLLGILWLRQRRSKEQRS